MKTFVPESAHLYWSRPFLDADILEFHVPPLFTCPLHVHWSWPVIFKRNEVTGCSHLRSSYPTLCFLVCSAALLHSLWDQANWPSAETPGRGVLHTYQYGLLLVLPQQVYMWHNLSMPLLLSICLFLTLTTIIDHGEIFSQFSYLCHKTSDVPRTLGYRSTVFSRFF